MGIVEALPPVDAAGAPAARTVPADVGQTGQSNEHVDADRIDALLRNQSGLPSWPEVLRLQ